MIFYSPDVSFLISALLVVLALWVETSELDGRHKALPDLHGHIYRTQDWCDRTATWRRGRAHMTTAVHYAGA